MNFLERIKRKATAIIGDILAFLITLTGHTITGNVVDRLQKRSVYVSREAAVPIRFYVPNWLSLWRARTLLSKEPGTINWIDEFGAGDVFWDIGANVGCYSLYAGVARKVRTFAFEPSPANYAVLARNIELNQVSDHISAFGIALADKTHIASLNMIYTEAAAAHSSFGEARNQYGNSFVPSYEYDALGFSIDDFLDIFKCPPPNHIKIDVDGIEDLIIAGGGETFRNPGLKSILIELNTDVNDYDRKAIAGLELAGFEIAERHEGKQGISNYVFRRKK